MRLRLLLLLGTTLALLPSPASAQLSNLTQNRGAPNAEPVGRDQPVTFTADSVEYDRDNGIVTATGHVEAWQGDYVLRADKITFDRNTNVAAAAGNVVLVQPDGQTLFSDYAELTQGMKEGVLRGMRALLADNGRLVGNGGRRVEGKVNELSRAVYSTCNLCAKDPSQPPLWQIRARSAIQDVENKRIEYRDAVIDIYGVPVAWFPYFTHADPSVKRASGFLVPGLGQSSHIGQFVSVPYYWAIDDQSDATIVPTLATKAGPNVETEYRRAFNDGVMRINAALGYDQSQLQAWVFANGKFAYNDTWRYGFDINRASSSAYLRDFHALQTTDLLTSQIYAEGFGEGSYARLDARAYQAITTSIKQTALPYVLPRYEYSYFGEPDRFGGRLSLDTSAFNVLREIGTNTQRAAVSLNWNRPFTGLLGDQWSLTLRTDAAGYTATSLDKQPNFSSIASTETAHAQPNAALMVHWPFVRLGPGQTSQLIEPIAQLVVGPNSTGVHNRKLPNEDSLDFEFTDANLFSINRFPGTDRVEGGTRANVGLHGAWYLGGNTSFDGLIGQSYRAHKDDTFPIGSGLENSVSDVVARASFNPTSYLDLTSRFRFDHRNFDIRFADATASAGVPLLRLSAGYLYSKTTPYYFYDAQNPPAAYFSPRNEITLNAASKIGNWSVAGFARRDLQRSEMVSAGFKGTYEDECFIFDVNFYRRFTSLVNDSGSTTVLFQITFKTVGQFGFHAF